MKSRGLAFTPFLLPALCPSIGRAMPESQKYDTSYQVYQEDNDRIRVESFYLRGEVELTADTAVRFQYLNDSISGSSPTGALPGNAQPYLAEIDEVREGILGAISHQFGDHRLEFEASRSVESDYDSTGLALSDRWDLNQKNTTLAFGINYLSDLVAVYGLPDQEKHGLDLFGGITQVIDKNTVVTANLTLGYNWGYLNDPYKVIQRNEIISFPDGDGGLIEIPAVNIYSENRPDERFRQVIQLQGTHYFEPVDGALDAVIRLSHDDYGIFSQSLRVEWHQAIGEKFEVTPFVRYYHQNAADFFSNTLNDVPIANPEIYPSGSSPNYSADYRLSSLDTYSLGIRLRYQFCTNFAANVSYERYLMSGSGPDASPSQSYPDADIWTFGLGLTF